MFHQKQQSFSFKLVTSFLIVANLLFFIPLNCFAGFLDLQKRKSHRCCGQQVECQKGCCDIDSKSSQDEQLPAQKAVFKTTNQKLFISLPNFSQFSTALPNVSDFRYDHHFLNPLPEDHLFLYLCSFLN